MPQEAVGFLGSGAVYFTIKLRTPKKEKSRAILNISQDPK